MWISGADNNVDRGQAVGRHSSTRPGHHPSWRHVDHSGVGRVEVASVFNSWRNLRGDACRRPFVDPCHLREMPLTVLVDREVKREVGECPVDAMMRVMDGRWKGMILWRLVDGGIR